MTSSPRPTETITPSITPKPTQTFPPTPSFTPTASGLPRYLSDMSPYSTENVEGGLQKDRVFWQSEIWIDGVHYEKGLGMHAPKSGVGRVQYMVPRGYKVFIALIGLARQDGNPGCSRTGEGDASFRVYVNAKMVLETDVLHFGQTKGVRIPVEEKDILTLEVDKGDDSYICDHSTWADARFEP